MKLEGKRITLRPMMLRERSQFFNWATRSDATPFWYGELYGDEVPSYVVFKVEWPDYYFTGSHPQKGRCFVIERERVPIGQINYNSIDAVDHSTELDILIADHKNQGQGLGTEAIRLLTGYLFREMSVRRCRIEVISRNPRAIRAYEKAGYAYTYTYIREGIEWLVMEIMADAPSPSSLDWPASSQSVPHPSYKLSVSEGLTSGY